MKAKALTLLILLVSVFITSCSDDPGNDTPTATLTSFEQSFVGNWFLKMVTNNQYFIETYTDTAHCKLWLKDSYYLDIGTTHYFHCDNGIYSCQTQVLPWAGNPPYLSLNTLDYTILEHTTNTLVLYNGGNEMEYHLTKNYSDLYSTCNFTYSVEFNNPIPAGYNGSILYLNYIDDNGITQSVDLTGMTTWSQTVSQSYSNQVTEYSYDLYIPDNISVDNGGSNWATLATFKISDSNGNILAQNGPKELCLRDYNSVIDCSNGADPSDNFDIILNCTN